MRIGELSRATSVSVRTIRYYEEIGLISPASRTEAGYRIFSDTHVRELMFIRSARHLGLTLDRIREILTAAADQSPCDCVRRTVQSQITAVDERIASLQEMRSTLASTLVRLERPASDDSDQAICPVIESGPSNDVRPLDSPVDWRL